MGWRGWRPGLAAGCQHSLSGLPSPPPPPPPSPPCPSWRPAGIASSMSANVLCPPSTRRPRGAPVGSIARAPCGRPRSRADIIFNNGGCYLCDMTDRGPYSGPASWGLKARPGVTSWVMYNDFDIILGPHPACHWLVAALSAPCCVLYLATMVIGSRWRLALRCCVRIGGLPNFDIILGHLTRASQLGRTPYATWAVLCFVSVLIGC